MILRLVPIVAPLLLPVSAIAETPDEWIALGAGVHGGFGAFIPLGIKIGLDAVKRLKAKPRELAVLYYDSDSSPCACFADGIALATYGFRRSAHVDGRAGQGPAGSGRRHRHPPAKRRRRLQIYDSSVGIAEARRDEQKPRSSQPL